MEVRGPSEAFTLLPWQQISPTALARHLSEQLTAERPENVERVTLTLSDEPIDGAAYGYSHGLKRHDGNCQRIAHGHRSRLHIFQASQRQPALEHQWAEWLDNSYLLEEADINDQSADQLSLAYHAAQGAFTMRLPRERCRILPTPTTVENIAGWLATRITQQTGVATTVHAYEGINKGATASATS